MMRTFIFVDRPGSSAASLRPSKTGASHLIECLQNILGLAKPCNLVSAAARSFRRTSLPEQLVLAQCFTYSKWVDCGLASGFAEPLGARGSARYSSEMVLSNRCMPFV
jgi:hypothetical protein